MEENTSIGSEIFYIGSDIFYVNYIKCQRQRTPRQEVNVYYKVAESARSAHFYWPQLFCSGCPFGARSYVSDKSLRDSVWRNPSHWHGHNSCV